MNTDFISYNYNLDPTTRGETIPRTRIPKTVRKKDSSRFRVGQFTFWLEQGVNDFSFLDIADTGFCDSQLVAEDSTDFLVSEDDIPLVPEDAVCGVNINRPRVDLSLSRNGNQSFGPKGPYELNPQGVHRGIVQWQRLGQANEITIQLQFWGLQRFVANDGILEIY